MLQQLHHGSPSLKAVTICLAQTSFAPAAWIAQVQTFISRMRRTQTKISLLTLAKTFPHLLQRFGVSSHSSASVALSVSNISFKADGFAAA
jgi:hypothetical protein